MRGPVELGQHFAQALGSPFLANHGLRLGRAAYAVVSGDGVEAFAAEAGRLGQPHPSGVSCEDLLESAAELEANRLEGSLSRLSHRAQLDRLYPDPAAPQRRGFEHLAGRIGDDDACELLALLTFLAFIHDDPCAWVPQLMSRSTTRKPRFCRQNMVFCGVEACI